MAAEPKRAGPGLANRPPDHPSVASRLRRALAERGVLGTVALAGNYVRLRARRARLAAAERWFDRRHGVDTHGVLFHADADDPAFEQALHYEGVRPAWFRRAVADLGADPATLTFVDMGCGKGRALVLAALAGFPRVIGVELSPALGEVARDNGRRYAARHPGSDGFEVVIGDASRFEFPPEPFALFLYNPFHEAVMRPVMENLAASLRERPRRAYVIYMNPVLADLLDSMPFLTRATSSERHVVYAAGDDAPPTAA